jgi:tetratricopeptide (TPR) repeat protein
LSRTGIHEHNNRSDWFTQRRTGAHRAPAKSRSEAGRRAGERNLEVGTGLSSGFVVIGRCPPAIGRSDQGLQLIDPLIDEQPNWTAAHFEYALALAGVGRGDEAIQALRQTVKLKPDHLEAWRVLGDHLTATGDNKAADAAYTCHVRCSTKEPVLQKADIPTTKN